ncbi:AMP-binding protein, partial [Lysinibacillus xylanilyticus]|uniref:AMP-binding protein n=1 Tax=Lysinibacillus xylanilyticus TaxID=582475 RepID=UPI0036DCD2AF
MNNGIILNSVRKAKVYWLEHFSEESTINSFSRNSISKSQINRARVSKSFYLPDDLSGEMMKLTEGSTQKLFVFINAFIMIALKKYTSEDFITIGVPIQTPSSEKIIPLQLSISEGDTFVDVLNKFSQQYVNGIVNQNFSIRQLSQELQLEADAPGLGVFDIAVSLSNLYSEQSILETNPALFIEFTYESSSEIKVCFNYNSAYFMEDEIKTVFINIMSLANQLIKNLDMPLGGVSFWDEEETAVFLKKREQLNSPVLLQTVLSQFEEQVSQTPNHIAIKTGEYLLTYEALYAQADQIRTGLQMQGIIPGMRVGVMMGRTPEVAVALFGIWKAGAVFVPLDETLPAERLRFIIEDADIVLILTKEERNLEISLPVPCMTLDECRNISWSGGYLDEDTVALSDPAYIIYTSGTTGKPKGVVVSHEGIANSITWRKQEYAFTTKDCIL